MLRAKSTVWSRCPWGKSERWFAIYFWQGCIEGIVFKKSPIRVDFRQVELPEPRRSDVFFGSVLANEDRSSIYLAATRRKKLPNYEGKRGVFVHLPMTEWGSVRPRHFLGGFPTLHLVDFSHRHPRSLPKSWSKEAVANSLRKQRSLLQPPR